MFPTVPLAFKRNVTVQRRQEGAYYDHEYHEGGVTESNLSGSVQPATEKDLKTAPGGESIEAGLKIYTEDSSVRVTDYILDGGNKYRVLKITPWNHNGYIKIIAGLVDA